jgi:hypothetical protein
MLNRLAAIALLAAAVLGMTGCHFGTASASDELLKDAWPVAKAAAVQIALGRSPGDGIPAVSEYSDQLRHPSDENYVQVWTPREDNFILLDDRTVQVNFIVQNSSDSSIPMVAYSINLRRTPDGWKFDGVASGG